MHILYATDGSDGALGAARFLAALPFRNSRVTVLSVTADGGAGDRALASACEILAAHFTIETQVRCGHAADEILQSGDEVKPDLIVVGSRGAGAVARFFLGSVAERVARHARSPVLVVRPSQGELDRVVVGVDGSDCAAYAADWVLQFPMPEGCEFNLVTVVTPRAEALIRSRAFPVPALMAEMKTLIQQELVQAQQRLEQLAAAFVAAGKTAAPLVRPDHPALGLLSAAEERRADLIVLGSHGVSALDRFLLGSVSEHVLRHALCSVLVVKQHEGSE